MFITRPVIASLATITTLTLISTQLQAQTTCPSTLDQAQFMSSQGDWSDDVQFVLIELSVSNELSWSVVFSQNGVSVDDDETLSAWVPPEEGENPYDNPIYDLNAVQGALVFKTSPAGETIGPGEPVSWHAAFDVSGAPADYQRSLVLRPEGAVGTPPDCNGDPICSGVNQFPYTLIDADISCTTGEPIFVAITSWEAESETITLSIEALDEGSSLITAYDAECTDGDGNTHSGTSPTGSVRVEGLTDDVDYTCTATATNDTGPSLASDATRSITPGTPAGLPIWLLHEATSP